MGPLEPLATRTAYVEGGFGDVPEHVDGLLARASRIVRGECAAVGVDIDQRIADGALDADLVADVVCDMVAYAAASPGGVGIESLQQGAGPYQETTKFVNPVGQLSFTRVHRRRLGVPMRRAFELDPAADARPGRGVSGMEIAGGLNGD